MNLDHSTMALLAVVLLVAGFVKGTIGFGLPLVALPVFTQFLPKEWVLALMVLPVVFSNLFIGFDGRHSSEDFALAAARVLAGAGITAHLYPTLAPTPLTARRTMTGMASSTNSVAAFEPMSTVMPRSRMSRRPKRSPMAPAGSSSGASRRR